jgi:hypothetical protein
VNFYIFFFTSHARNHLCHIFIQATSIYPHFRSIFVLSVSVRRCMMYLQRGESLTACCCHTHDINSHTCTQVIL